MRYIFVTHQGVTDTLTGEVSDHIGLDQLLLSKPGGIIAGRNLYPLLAPLANAARADEGWTASVHLQHKRQGASGVGGVIYISRLSYRFPKVREGGRRFRPGSVKWLVFNLELYTESLDVEGAARALVDLAEQRGIRPRHSPGAFGAAMLRASPGREPDRRCAPWFISEAAREHLPGNYYALRHGYRTTPRAYYIDQRSSHHSVARSIRLPHPHYLRARGRFRATENERTPPWIDADNLHLLCKHVGLLHATVECSHIPLQVAHLYPPWARDPGRRAVWIWTPELRLFDSKVRLRWVTSGLTSYVADAMLAEYAEWSLARLAEGKHSAVKPALLAAYGILAVQQNKELDRYHVHGRAQPPRSEVCRLPLLDRVYRSTVRNMRVSNLQNVVARGVIEAEVRTRSIELARTFEDEGVSVVHVYADGLLAATDQLPLLPEGWRVQAALTDVHSPSPNSIRSRELVRLPGIPNGRRTDIVRPSFGSRHAFGKSVIHSVDG